MAYQDLVKDCVGRETGFLLTKRLEIWLATEVHYVRVVKNRIFVESIRDMYKEKDSDSDFLKISFFDQWASHKSPYMISEDELKLIENFELKEC